MNTAKEIQNWHTSYPKTLKNKSVESLRYIIEDCKKAIQAMPDNPKNGQYQDTIHYCAMELENRKVK